MQDGPAAHPQEVMKSLGITYQHATPQSLYEQWWFWNCENCPAELPPYLRPLSIAPMDAIGYGLSPEMAADIVKREDELRRPRLPDYQQRVVAEKQELDEKLEKLNAFGRGDVFPTLPEEEQERLIRQSKIMDQYSVVLGERIAAFTQEEAPRG